MTRIDAIGVLNSLKSMNLPKKPIMIVMSTYNNGVISSQVMEAGASYFIPMPFDHDLLAERINQLAGIATEQKQPYLDRMPYNITTCRMSKLCN